MLLSINLHKSPLSQLSVMDVLLILYYRYCTIDIVLKMLSYFGSWFASRSSRSSLTSGALLEGVGESIRNNMGIWLSGSDPLLVGSSQ